MLISRTIILALTLVSFSGCLTVPDLKPFAQSTVELKDTVALAGDVGKNAINSDPFLKKASGTDSNLKTLTDGWVERTKLVSELSNYSQVLADAVDAGNSGAESVQNVADAVVNLSSVFSAHPLGAGVTTAVDIIKKGYTLVAADLAARNVSRTIQNADPIIQKISKLLVDDVKKLEQLQNNLDSSLEAHIYTQTTSERAYRKRLIERRGKLQVKITNTIGSGAAAQPNALDIKNLAVIEKLIKETDSWHDQYLRNLENVAKQSKQQHAVLSRMKLAISQWGAIHAKLAVTVLQKSSPDVQNLLKTTLEIRDLLNKTEAD